MSDILQDTTLIIVINYIDQLVMCIEIETYEILHGVLMESPRSPEGVSVESW